MQIKKSSIHIGTSEAKTQAVPQAEMSTRSTIRGPKLPNHPTIPHASSTVARGMTNGQYHGARGWGRGRSLTIWSRAACAEERSGRLGGVLLGADQGSQRVPGHAGPYAREP